MPHPIACSKSLEVKQGDYDAWMAYIGRDASMQRLAELGFDVWIKPKCTNEDCIGSQIAAAQLYSQKHLGFKSPAFLGYKEMVAWLKAYESLVDECFMGEEDEG